MKEIYVKMKCHRNYINLFLAIQLSQMSLLTRLNIKSNDNHETIYIQKEKYHQ